MFKDANPSFTDKKILTILNEKFFINFSQKQNDYLILSKNYKEIWARIFVGESDASSKVKLLHTYRPPYMEIIFNDDMQTYGSFLYWIQQNPFDRNLDLSFFEARFFAPFGETRAFLTKSEAIEKMININEFQEWLFWNQL